MGGKKTNFYYIMIMAFMPSLEGIVIRETVNGRILWENINGDYGYMSRCGKLATIFNNGRQRPMKKHGLPVSINSLPGIKVEVS